MGFSSSLCTLYVIFRFFPDTLNFQVVALGNNETVFFRDCRVREGPVSRRTQVTNCSLSVDDNTTTSLIYNILEGNINNIFSIDSNGTVYQDAGVDREEIASFSIYVLAMTSYGQNISAYLNITIDDVNDNPPQVSEQEFIRTITLADIKSNVTSFYQVQATDRDSGKNSELNYSMEYIRYPIKNIGEVVGMNITVSDLGDPQLSTIIMGRFDINGPCPIEKHTINATTGRLTSLLLCDVELLSTSTQVVSGDTVGLTCRYISNAVKFIFNFVRVNNASTTSAEQILNVTNITSVNAGPYICQVISEFGVLNSDIIYIFVQGK